MKVAPWVAVWAVALGLASACGGDSDTSWGGSSGSSGIAAGAPNGVSGKGGNGGSAGAGLSGSSAGGRATAGEGGRAQSGAASIGGAEGGAEAVNVGGEGVTGGAGGEVGTAGAGGAPPSDGGAAGSESAAGAGAGGEGGVGGEAHLDCEEEVPMPTQLPSCGPSAAVEPCRDCLKARCCLEWQACYGKAPNSICGYGMGPHAPGQMDCIRECYLENYPASPDPQEILSSCAATCTGACVYLAQITDDLVACGLDECADECFPIE